MADGTYKLIGVVRGNATTMTKATDASPEGRAKAEVQIEDITGLKATWGTFHVSIVKDLQLGKWYEFEVATPTRKEGQGVWHNLESVIRGPMEKPAPGTTGHQEAETATGPAHTVKSDAQFARERTSLQRQGAMGIVLRLMEAGIPLDTMAETIPEVLRHAATIEAFYERDIEQPAAPKATRSRKAPEQAALPAADAEAPVADKTAAEAPVADKPAPAKTQAPTNGSLPDFAHVGQLLTWFTGQFKGKTSHDLCDLVGAKNPQEIEDYRAAAEAAREKWGAAA